jgi:hypothetical protein
MALRTHQAPKLSGTSITYDPADAAGDTFGHTPNGVLRVKNGGTATRTVTVVAPGNTAYGQADPDIPVPVAVGAEVAIGPFPGGLAVEGVVSVTYDAVTSVTVAYS